MNMRRPPRVVMIAPGISARLDREETVIAVVVRDDPARAGEIGVERRRMIVAPKIASCGIALPKLHERSSHRPSVFIKHAPGNNNALSNGLTGVLAREVVIGFADGIVSVERPRQLRHRVRNLNERLRWCAPAG